MPDNDYNMVQDIDQRMADIHTEIQQRGNVITDEELTRLEGEVATLETRRAQLIASNERRSALLGRVASGDTGTTTRAFGRLAAQGQQSAQDEGAEESRYDSTEYRRAFMSFVTRGTPIPTTYRTDENTLTTDVSTVIPTTITNKIVEKMESTGMILPLVTRTAIATGVAVPTSSVRPVATFVLEGASSDKQKKTTSSITFGKFKLRCEISFSAETGVMALQIFEAAFIRQVSEAMVKAIEGKIVSADAGTTCPKGILAETPESGQALTAKTLTYDKLVAMEAALPQAYEANAVWCMTKKSFMGFIGMQDAEGNPIARVNYGIGGKPERSLLGRSVVLCGDYLPSYSTSLTTGAVFAFLFNFQDYVLNTVYDMGIERRRDWETEDNQVKAVMAVDGKVVDKGSLVTLAKSA